MNAFLEWYLYGCAVSLLINLILAYTAHVVKVSNLLGYLLNTALSWGCLATWLFTSLVGLLNRKGWNKVVWTSKEYKEMEQKAGKMPNQKLSKKK